MIHANQHAARGSSKPKEDETNVLGDKKLSQTGRGNSKEKEVNVEHNVKLENHKACEEDKTTERAGNLGNWKYYSSKQWEYIYKMKDELASSDSDDENSEYGRKCSSEDEVDESEEIIMKNNITETCRDSVDVDAGDIVGKTLLHVAARNRATEEKIIHANKHRRRGSSKPKEDGTKVLEDNKSAQTGCGNSKEKVPTEANVEPNVKLENHKAFREDKMTEGAGNLRDLEYQNYKRWDNTYQKEEEMVSSDSEDESSKYVIELEEESPSSDKDFDESEEIWFKNGVSEACRGWVDVHTRNLYGITMLHAAARFGSVDAVRRCLEMGADVNARDIDGSTPLMMATYRDHVQVMEVLMGAGADISLVDYKAGHTALFPAAYFGKLSAVKLLLSAGCDPNHRDTRGRNPLHLAVRNERGYAVAEALLEAGASASAREIIMGFTPLDMAVLRRDIPMIMLFERYSATCD